MTIHNHLYTFHLVTSFWALYFLGGLWSNYYLDWHWIPKILVIDLLPALAVFWYIKNNLRKQKGKIKFWLAFYFSVPFLFYDFIYLKLYLNHGWCYLINYWHLTGFSVIPIVILLSLNKIANYEIRESK